MSTPWEGKLDPSDKVDFYADFGATGDEGTEPVLDTGEKITTYTALPSAKAAEKGLLLDQAGDYAHSKVNGDRSIKMWLSIDEAKRTDCNFNTGIGLDVEVTIETDAVPPRRFQRTWTITVRHL